MHDCGSSHFAFGSQVNRILGPSSSFNETGIPPLYLQGCQSSLEMGILGEAWQNTAVRFRFGSSEQKRKKPRIVWKLEGNLGHLLVPRTSLPGERLCVIPCCGLYNKRTTRIYAPISRLRSFPAQAHGAILLAPSAHACYHTSASLTHNQNSYERR